MFSKTIGSRYCGHNTDAKIHPHYSPLNPALVEGIPDYSTIADNRTNMTRKEHTIPGASLHCHFKATFTSASAVLSGASVTDSIIRGRLTRVRILHTGLWEKKVEKSTPNGPDFAADFILRARNV